MIKAFTFLDILLLEQIMIPKSLLLWKLTKIDMVRPS